MTSALMLIQLKFGSGPTKPWEVPLSLGPTVSCSSLSCLLPQSAKLIPPSRSLHLLLFLPGLLCPESFP